MSLCALQKKAWKTSRFKDINLNMNHLLQKVNHLLQNV